jgi:hypothetical protein
MSTPTSITPGGQLVVAEPAVAPVARRSRLFPEGTRLAHADLHNHSLLSDGDGTPERAFVSMREAGLDVAALTDHAILGHGALSRMDPCARLRALGDGTARACRAAIGLDDAGWRRTGELADAADEPGAFAAIRGFEWTNPVLGHLNVWFSSAWTDALHTTGIGWDGIADEARNLPGVGEVLHDILDALPGDPGMRPLYDWLLAPPGEGGLDGLAGFNHPGREPGWFDAFGYDARVADRIVSVELFNKREEFLFDDERDSPLVACLNAGWRVGPLGVSDEHGDDWGFQVGKGRAGLWVREVSRDGVREALLARRFYATNQRALRLDASVGGVRMGGSVPHRRGPLTFAVDLERPGWEGRTLQLQVLRPGARVPEVAHVRDVTLGRDTDPVLTFTVDLDADDGPWIVLRLANPRSTITRPGPRGHPANLAGIAYASPWWLDPDG